MTYQTKVSHFYIVEDSPKCNTVSLTETLGGTFLLIFKNVF